MTAPPVPADLDLRDFQFMPLDVVRLVDSDLTAIASGEEFKAAVLLWCKAWHQIPAASLPNDDRLLAHLAGFGRDLKGWKKVREVALRGFALADDGRLYHPVIAEKANEAGGAKQRRREQTEAATRARLARKAEREKADSSPTDEQRNVAANEERNVPRNVHQGTGTGTGTGILEEEEGARARRATFEETEAALRSIRELEGHPVSINTVIAPIWQLVLAGYDLKTQILPTIRNRAPQAKGPIRLWSYFVESIVADAQQKPIPAPKDAKPHGTHRGNSIAGGFDLIERAIAAEERAIAEAQGGHGSGKDDPIPLPRLRKGAA